LRIAAYFSSTIDAVGDASDFGAFTGSVLIEAPLPFTLTAYPRDRIIPTTVFNWPCSLLFSFTAMKYLN
jgi:hypothetical protein